ncbi:chymotrypsin-like elastase family member 1 [Convolutriloba macropyga]|uniref:chymotrypsin-like elastase family member 1 n=1 Tax=Convolutriloba macropyga TaxID=536237 RepID=UPI003F523579
MFLQNFAIFVQILLLLEAIPSQKFSHEFSSEEKHEFEDLFKPQNDESEDLESLFKSETSSMIINGIDTPQRLFYARLKYTIIPGFCGATIIDERYVITAAHCVHFLKPEHLLLEVGDFSLAHSLKKHYTIRRIHLAPGFNASDIFASHDIAILKTDMSIKRAPENGLRICPDQIPESYEMQYLLGSCGMGSTQNERTSEGTSETKIPPALKEMFFSESMIDRLGPFNVVPCPSNVVCTRPLFNSGNICLMDDGNPLFRFQCGSFEPDCLYGVASYSKANPSTEDKICNDGSYFARIHPLKNWIERIIHRTPMQF